MVSINSLRAGFFRNFCCLLTFFSKLTFSKISFRSIIRVSNSLDPDQDRQNVRPDRNLNCLPSLSADLRNRHQQVKRLKSIL